MRPPLKKIYYLSSCSTCSRILRGLGAGSEFKYQDIKTDKITPAQLDEMCRLSGNYESLFSRVALKYRILGLHEKKLGERDYRRLILDEYTFLKRPVIIIGERIFIGNSPKNVAAAKAAMV